MERRMHQGKRQRQEANSCLVSMVSTRRARMASMDRLLANGNYRDLTTEEANHDKLAAQTICRNLREADEANLLEEEDMHVFDSKPMMDPLHLVRCKICKKPVKDSQHATHSERCKSFNTKEESVLELDGGTGYKKPPRKGRKKLQTAQDNQGTTVGEQERFVSLGRENAAASVSNPGDLTGTTSFCRDAKRNAPSIGGTCVMDGSVIIPGRNCPAVVTAPSEKRTKSLVTENLLLSEGREIASGVTTKNHVKCQEGLIYSLAPLATKVYHSQRNLRLRSALNHIYHEASFKKQSSDPLSPVPVQTNVIGPHVSSSNNLLHESEPVVLPQKKQKDAYSLPAVRKPDQMLAQSSELYLGKSSGYSSSMNFSNQFRETNFSRSVLSVDTASIGMIRSRYRPTAYSYPGNSGASLTVMQQSNGSVPVL